MENLPHFVLLKILLYDAENWTTFRLINRCFNKICISDLFLKNLEMFKYLGTENIYVKAKEEAKKKRIFYFYGPGNNIIVETFRGSFHFHNIDEQIVIRRITYGDIILMPVNSQNCINKRVARKYIYKYIPVKFLDYFNPKISENILSVRFCILFGVVTLFGAFCLGLYKNKK
jgi:hypothetical protein